MPASRIIRRHDLVFIRRESWRTLLMTRDDFAAIPLATRWIENGWPVVARRYTPDDKNGVPLGLPLPSSAGKRRLSVCLPPDSIVAVVPPLSLKAVCRDAPEPWQPMLEELAELAVQHWVDIRVCGDLAWQVLTSLNYLTDRSDLEVLIQIHPGVDVRALTAALAGIECAAPTRLEGELIREDGAAADWREFHDGAHEVLVQTISSAARIGSGRFISGGPLF